MFIARMLGRNLYKVFSADVVDTASHCTVGAECSEVDLFDPVLYFRISLEFFPFP